MTASDHGRMSSVDTAWLRMDRPGNPMMIVGVTVTATPVSFKQFTAMLESRFLCFPRFRYRPVRDALGASWLESEEFTLEAHLERVRLPEPAGKAELEALTAELAAAPLDPAQPMWRFHFIGRYGGGSAWIMRMHHCYADGMAMIRVLLSMAEQDPAPAMAASKPTAHAAGKGGDSTRQAREPAFAPLWLLRRAQQLSRPAGDILESALAEGARLLEGGVHQLLRPGQAALHLSQAASMARELAKVLALPDDPQTPLRGRLSGTKRVAWAEPIPLREVKIVGRALGCTVNDVLMATVAGALGEHLRSQHFDTDRLAIRASMPINLRTAEEPLTLGNKFGLVFVDLPIGIRDPLQRVLAVHQTMGQLKDSMQPPMTLLALGLMGWLPAAAETPLIDMFSRKGSLVASNVPGPQAPIYICGQRIAEMYFWVPQSGTMGLGVSILSYAGQVFFGVIADRALVEDPRGVVERFCGQFERLLLAVTVGALAAKKKTQKKKKKGASRRGKPRRGLAPPR